MFNRCAYVLYRPCLIGVYVLYRPCLIGVYVLYRPCLIGVYVLYRPCLIGVYVLYRPCLIGVYVLLTLGAHAQRGLQYLVCHSVCLSVRHAILAVHASKSIMKDTIVLSVRFAAILK